MHDDIYSSPLTVTEQFFFCGVPLKLDTYSGCGHRCLYCFSKAAELGHSSRKSKGRILPTDPSIIKHQMTKALDWHTRSESIVIEWLRRHVPIHWGGMSDPFQPLERQLKLSLNIMDHLNWYQYPTVISTKGDIIAEPDYIARLKEGKYAVQVSLITKDDTLAKKLEPGAPSASKRLAVLETLAKAGIWTACRIQPLIPASSIEYEVENLITTLADVGVKHILIEGYKVPSWNPVEQAFVDEACGGKVRLEYKRVGATPSGMETVLPSWRKWQYLEPAITATHRNHMTFGAADNDFRDVGDVKCCCGIDNLPSFENYWQYQTARAAEIAKSKGSVCLDDMNSEWHGNKPFNFNMSSLTFEGNTRLRAPVKYYVDRAWRSGDHRSPNCLVNLTLVRHNGQVCYQYDNKLNQLSNNAAIQGVLL